MLDYGDLKHSKAQQTNAIKGRLYLINVAQLQYSQSGWFSTFRVLVSPKQYNFADTRFLVPIFQRTEKGFLSLLVLGVCLWSFVFF